MSCRRARNLLIPYLEGALSEESREAMARHLQECPACGVERDSLRDTLSLLRATRLPAVEPSPHLWEAIRTKIERPAPPLWHRYGYILATPTLALVAILTFIALSSRTPSPPPGPHTALWNPEISAKAKSAVAEIQPSIAKMASPLAGTTSGNRPPEAKKRNGIRAPLPPKEPSRLHSKPADAIAPPLMRMAMGQRTLEDQEKKGGLTATPKTALQPTVAEKVAKADADITMGHDMGEEGPGFAAGAGSSVAAGVPGGGASASRVDRVAKGGGRSGDEEDMAGMSSPAVAMGAEEMESLEGALFAESIKSERQKALFRYP